MTARVARPGIACGAVLFVFSALLAPMVSSEERSLRVVMRELSAAVREHGEYTSLYGDSRSRLTWELSRDGTTGIIVTRKRKTDGSSRRDEYEVSLKQLDPEEVEVTSEAGFSDFTIETPDSKLWSVGVLTANDAEAVKGTSVAEDGTRSRYGPYKSLNIALNNKKGAEKVAALLKEAILLANKKSSG